jgi:hypothetical protein
MNLLEGNFKVSGCPAKAPQTQFAIRFHRNPQMCNLSLERVQSLKIFFLTFIQNRQECERRRTLVSGTPHTHHIFLIEKTEEV